MYSRLQSQLWSKEELARRATRWAESRGWTGVTVSSLLKWKQEGLFPRPIVRSLGQGRGSVSGWPWPAYRRLLRIVTHRQRLRRWRDLRIALWLDGYDLDLSQVRSDLVNIYEESVLKVNEDLRTDRWDVVGDAPPSRVATRAITRRFLAPKALEGWLQQLEPDPGLEPLFRLALTILATPPGQRAAVAFIHQFVATGPGDIPAAISAVRASLPAALAAGLDGDEKEWASHAGLLAHPDGFENPLLVGVEEASDVTLMNLREASRQAGPAWCASMRLATAVFEARPEVLGPFRIMAPVVSRLTRTMASRSPFQSVESRVTIMAFALASASVRLDEGRRLSDGLLLISQLAAWLTDHKDLLRSIERLSEEQWTELMDAPDFPSEAKQLLLAAQASERGAKPASLT